MIELDLLLFFHIERNLYGVHLQAMLRGATKEEK